MPFSLYNETGGTLRLEVWGPAHFWPKRWGWKVRYHGDLPHGSQFGADKAGRDVKVFDDKTGCMNILKVDRLNGDYTATKLTAADGKAKFTEIERDLKKKGLTGDPLDDHLKDYFGRQSGGYCIFVEPGRFVEVEEKVRIVEKLVQIPPKIVKIMAMPAEIRAVAEKAMAYDSFAAAYDGMNPRFKEGEFQKIASHCGMEVNTKGRSGGKQGGKPLLEQVSEVDAKNLMKTLKETWEEAKTYEYDAPEGETSLGASSSTSTVGSKRKERD